MRQRSVSAIGVVIVGIVPGLFGGPLFTTAIAVICLLGLAEFRTIARLAGARVGLAEALSIMAFGLIALFNGNEFAIIGVCAFSVAGPLILAIIGRPNPAFLASWAMSAAATLYLGIPVYAAVATRELSGTIDAGWLTRVADELSIGWTSAPRGLAWTLLVLAVTWMSDTGAYLVGRSIGRRPLVPLISPKKTVEGLGGGLICAALTGWAASALFGLGLPPWAALGAGLLLGAVSVFGDLAESLMKRCVGLKDSGSLIPGHGGVLDRIDALLFTWPAGLYLAVALDRWVVSP